MARRLKKKGRGKRAMPDLKGLRVLAAEDNDFNQMVVRELLGQLGCTVTIANNGEEAVLEALANTYDVILMDCQMPGVDGFEATRRIREHEKIEGGHRPIVALTANAIKGDREQCLAAGMDDYVTKPIEIPALVRTIASLLPGGGPEEDASHATDAPLNRWSKSPVHV
jgi:CheY-like chemotaxis protein